MKPKASKIFNSWFLFLRIFKRYSSKVQIVRKQEKHAKLLNLNVFRKQFGMHGMQFNIEDGFRGTKFSDIEIYSL